ncbi:hypothetical protein QVD17_33586 [Tagetes erecta]|uniref:CBF1-interacting co-repressor CIR N-terminal domain-containing protein n=1 Tax=Tagetes erecta TaxID=13708 RepID=A0AAD8NL61_TARER|nr:hypothetical protein QVD17_33586 [Tagetes erecta]
MGMKFLNKKGWHTGSLRNIENVWKAEQKHDAEQKKLEELRKQIHEEREKAEFRLLQEQAGLVPRQERLDFLYDSGLSVGKGNSEGGFKALESVPSKPEPEQSASTKPSAPGALFEDKPQSANDAWRKLHSDPLLMIRQREQEALARVKNNPVQMAMIRKSVEAKKHKGKASDGENRKEKHHRKKSKHEKHHSSSSKHHTNSDEEERSVSPRRGSKYNDNGRARMNTEYEREDRLDSQYTKRERDRPDSQSTKRERDRPDSLSTKRERNRPPTHPKGGSDGPHKRLSQEERAAKLKEMQMDAELHEEQRWRRLKQADDDDAKEVSHASSRGRNFLDAAHKSIYGAEKGGSSTIEESVRRRTHYSQRRSEGNAFRR